jgi:hypothetical protein
MKGLDKTFLLKWLKKQKTDKQKNTLSVVEQF